MDDLLTTDEVAAMCRTSPSTVHHWRYMKKGPRAVKVGRRILYPRAECARWLQALYDEGEAASTPTAGRQGQRK